MTRSPLLVLVTGPPGTGKSSLADRAADHLGAPVFGWDWTMAGLKQFPTIQDALGDMTFADHRRVGWSILWNLATAQLRRGSSVILDGVARDIEVAGTREVASIAGVSSLVVVTSCRDRELHRSRIAGRQRNIPGWHELTWEHVVGVLDRWEEPADVDLPLDAADPFDDNAAVLLRHCAASA